MIIPLSIALITMVTSLFLIFTFSAFVFKIDKVFLLFQKLKSFIVMRTLLFYTGNLLSAFAIVSI